MKQPWYSFLYIKSPIVKIGIAIVAILLSIALILFQGLIEEQRMEAQDASWLGRSTEIGAGLFANNCASCHGLDGKGLPVVAPALNSRYFFTQRLNDVDWAGSQEQYVLLTLHAGRPSKVSTQWVNIMPTWGSEYGGPMREDQIQDITNYVMNWQPTAVLQTAEEDPWQFFQDSLAKELPYLPDEPGFDAKVEQALAAATAAGATNYSIAGADAPPPADMEEGAITVRDPETLFATMGCIGCHNLDLPQDDANKGPVGPNMGNLAENAANRVVGQDAEQYVHESIISPNNYIVSGYNSGIMPQNFSEQMSQEEIAGLVTWLLAR